MRSVSGVGRIAAVAAILGTVVLFAIVLFGGGGASYEVTAKFLNAAQLVKGNEVQVSGNPIGRVTDIDIAEDGQAIVELKLTDEKFTPLRVGTRAVVRQFSQSGLANRFVDLEMPPGSGGPTIADGGRIGVDSTRTAVDLDQLFNTIDARTRKGLRGTLRGLARQYAGRGKQWNEGYLYLNPALSTSAELFNELNRDNPTLRRFLIDSSRLVTALASRRVELADLIGNLNTTTRALGARQDVLADAVGRLPGFMRQANTTFVNLRAALTDLDPLIEETKPVAQKLGPFLDAAQPFARDAKPTIADLNQVLRRRGRSNDLYELLETFPPFKSTALDTKNRSVDFGTGKVSVGNVRGSFPETQAALKASTPIIAHGRPYTTELVGWFDDFSNRGAFDALGGFSRTQTKFSNFVVSDEGLVPITTLAETRVRLKTGQYRRCPGASEPKAADGSNVWSEAEQQELDCTEAHRAVVNP